MLGGQLGRQGFAAKPGEYRESGAEEREAVQDSRHVQLLDDDLPLYEEVVDALSHVLPGEREEGHQGQGDVVLGQVGGERQGDLGLVQLADQLLGSDLVEAGQADRGHLQCVVVDHLRPSPGGDDDHHVPSSSSSSFLLSRPKTDQHLLQPVDPEDVGLLQVLQDDEAGAAGGGEDGWEVGHGLTGVEVVDVLLQGEVLPDDLRDEGLPHSGAAEQHQDSQLALPAGQEPREIL